MRSPLAQPVVAGVVCAVVGFTSSFAVVLAGLRTVGASPAQSVSGLMAVTAMMGLGSVAFSWRTRVPITVAWTTPGVALLAGATAPAGGFASAVGAFVVTGILLVLAGLVRPFGDLVQRVPVALANAMLAGVLLTLCVAPFVALARTPAAIAPVVVVWLVMLRLAPTWAVPAALVVATGVMGATGALGHVADHPLLPSASLVVPRFDLTAVTLGVPLFLVTMTSQNIPGVAVMRGLGYRVPWLPALAYTGGASVVGAFFGGPPNNLAAISAALAAGPDAGPDPARRWVAGMTTGLTHLAMVPACALVVAVAQAAPPGLFAAIAGLALVGTWANAATSGLGDADHRMPAALTMVVAASGFSVAGTGPAFWSLAAGLVAYAMLRRRPEHAASPRPSECSPRA